MVHDSDPSTVDCQRLEPIWDCRNALWIRRFHFVPLVARLAGNGQGRSHEAFFQVACNWVDDKLRSYALGTDKGVKGKGGERGWQRKGHFVSGHLSE